MEQEGPVALRTDEAPSRQPQLMQNLKRFATLKVMLISCAFLSLVFLLSSIFVDTYIQTHADHPVKFEHLNVDVVLPASKIGAMRIAVTLSGEQEKGYKYSDLAKIQDKDASKSIDDKSLETFLSSDLVSSLGFRLPITTIDYASAAGTFVVVLDAFSIIFTAMAIIFQMLFRAEPDSFILRPGISAKVSISRKDMLRSGLPGFCLLVSACCSMMHAVVISSFIHNMVFRIVAYSIFNSGVGGGSLAGFRVSMLEQTVSSKQEQLKLMQFIGRYLTNGDNVSFGFSFYAILISIGLSMTVLFVLYYNDNTIARSKTNAAAVPLTQPLAVTASVIPVDPITQPTTAVPVVAPLVTNADTQWKLLPWHCRVRPLGVSIAIFFLGLGVTAVGGNVARARGVKMNRHPFEVDGAPRSFIDDVVISHTTDYFFSTAGIVDGAVMIFMPLLLMVAISSLDRVKFASKVLELLGVIFFMRGISVMATIMPTLFNVLQHPQCWDQPGSSLGDKLAEKEFCNDLMFSGHTVFCFLPALIFVFSIVYGPYSYKPVLISSVLLSAAALTSLIIVGRLHYTSDVVVAITLTALLVVMNAPVWKLQFSFRKSQLGVGSVSAIDKVPGYLELCIERLNLFTVTVQDSLSGTEEEEGKQVESWTKIEETYAKLGALIEQVKEDSIRSEKAELEAIENQEPLLPASTPDIEEVHDERQPLLNNNV